MFISLTTNFTVSSGAGVKFSSSGVDLISKFISKFSDIFFEDRSNNSESFGIFWFSKVFWLINRLPYLDNLFIEPTSNFKSSS